MNKDFIKGNLSAWEKVEIARHKDRPKILYK